MLAVFKIGELWKWSRWCGMQSHFLIHGIDTEHDKLWILKFRCDDPELVSYNDFKQKFKDKDIERIYPYEDERNE